ncbi:MAG: glycosyltransferase [Lachnospiraceae bacterium]|nr:glycosyltransferase [Lachnospiraceae bacterium]
MEKLFDRIDAKIENPVIDVILSAYQHEDYLRQTLDSILSQKTRYPFRIIAGDDCSPDGTGDIILEYQRAHPDVITSVIWKKNSFSMGMRNAYELVKMSDAKYLATVEGDDYWTDNRKLEKQVDFLEDNPDYSACMHNVRSVDEDGAFFHRGYEAYPYRPEYVYTEKDALGLRLASHTSSLVFRNFYLDWDGDDWAMYEKCRAHGDILRTVHLGMTGKILFMEDYMSCYRGIIRESAIRAQIRRKRSCGSSILISRKFIIIFITDSAFLQI